MIFIAQSMECCSDKFMEKLLSRTGRVGKREPWWWQFCYAATSFLLLGSYWERGTALSICTRTRAGKSPQCTCYLARHCSSIAWGFRGGKGADIEATASVRKVHGEHHGFGAFTVSAPNLALLAVWDPCRIKTFEKYPWKKTGLEYFGYQPSGSSHLAAWL